MITCLRDESTLPGTPKLGLNLDRVKFGLGRTTNPTVMFILKFTVRNLGLLWFIGKVRWVGLGMDDNERDSVKELLVLARYALMALLVVGGYLQRDVLLGVM